VQSDGQAQVWLIDASAPSAIQVVKQWEIPCTPIGAAIRKNYDFFAVSCSNGMLFLGTLAADRSLTQLKKIRQYHQPRRALLLDPVRNALYAFTTSLGDACLFDSVYEDTQTYSDDGAQTSVANEIPDEFEKRQRDRSNKARQESYQFVAIDLAAEAANAGEAFPYRDIGDPIVRKELRWMYFNLKTADGKDDLDLSALNGFRYYKTNFWKASWDPSEANVFYLSQRGARETGGLKSCRYTSPHANNVIKVTIAGDIVSASAADKPKTSDVLKFERIYGFTQDFAAFGYPFVGDFEMTRVGGLNVLLVNQFRDLKNWFRSKSYFGISSKIMGNTATVKEIGSQSTRDAFYEMALTSAGRGASCVFYTGAVALFTVKDDGQVVVTQRIQ